MVKVLKAHNGPTGFVQAGADIEIDVNRHCALARVGIVPPLEGEAPSAPPAGVKHALSNSDFKPRREKLTADKDTKAAPSAPADKGGSAAAK
jgi:hypothetical protein